ncbi:hypothetical protein LTR85_011290 [Meristemomyces frigidus]|nr:hypothetical protein LTR85_011290 [Meristemomyces frigidus]
MRAFAALLAVLAVTEHAEASINKWTPEGFNWTAMSSREGVLYQNVSASTPSKELVVYYADRYNVSEKAIANVEILGIGVAIGWAVSNPVSFTLTAVGVASTISGCLSAITAPSIRGTLGCVGGLASTIGGLGLAKSADKAITGIAGRFWGRNLWDGSGLELIDLDVFTSTTPKRSAWKRDLEDRGLPPDEQDRQMLHDYLTHRTIRQAGYGEGEFLGYEPAHHQLAKRSDGVHPLVPRFRFEHHKYGPMVVATRDTNTTSHITVEPFSAAKHLRRDDTFGIFEGERLDSNLMEGRFDYEATQADSATLSTDAESSFDMVEGGLECFVNDQGLTTWPSQATIDMQMYDTTNKETFGYGSIGLFTDHTTDSQFGNLQPAPPLTGGENC